MQDFEKKLMKENLELQLKILKNKVFIWHNKKFKELALTLQRLQLRQYFAQEEYAEALSERIALIIGEQGINAVYEALKKIFLQKFIGHNLCHKFTDSGVQKKYYNIREFSKKDFLICGADESFKFSCLTLYAFITEGRYLDENSEFIILEN